MAEHLYRFLIEDTAKHGIMSAIDEADQTQVFLYCVPASDIAESSQAHTLSEKIGAETGHEVFSNEGNIYFVTKTRGECGTLRGICIERGLVTAPVVPRETVEVRNGFAAQGDGAQLRNIMIAIAALGGAVLIIVVVLATTLGHRSRDDANYGPQRTLPTAAPKAAAPPAENSAPVEQTPSSPILWSDVGVLGQDSAPVKIQLFFSPTCSHCVTFFQNTLPMLEQEYANRGYVQISFYVYPLGPADYAVEYVAHCLPKERYAEYYGKIFAYQDRAGNWPQGAETAVVKDALYSIAESEGLSATDTDRCIEAGERDGRNLPAFTGGDRGGLQGVTALVIDGQTYSGSDGINSREVLGGIIDRKMSGGRSGN